MNVELRIYFHGEECLFDALIVGPDDMRPGENIYMFNAVDNNRDKWSVWLSGPGGHWCAYPIEDED
jgi:hypothetical protein